MPYMGDYAGERYRILRMGLITVYEVYFEHLLNCHCARVCAPCSTRQSRCSLACPLSHTSWAIPFVVSAG